MLTESMDQRLKSHKDTLEKLLQSERVSLSGRPAVLLPDDPGVYRISEIASALTASVYVGESISIRVRVCRNHLLGYANRSTLRRKMLNEGIFKEEEEIGEYLRDRCQVQCIIIRDTRERMLFEHFAVSVLSPRWNS